MKTMKAKDYAIELGLARPGKGRMSLDAHKAIRAAIDAGTHTFPDYGVTKGATPKGIVLDKDKGSDAPVLPVERADNYGPAFMRYPLDQMFTGKDSAGKVWKVSARNACRNSAYSIVGCGCPLHVTLVGGGEWIEVRPVGE